MLADQDDHDEELNKTQYSTNAETHTHFNARTTYGHNEFEASVNS